MSAVDVTQLLLQAQDPDAVVRNQAEHSIQEFQDKNYPGFLISLAAELGNVNKPPDSRRLAGLVLKNNLDAKEEARKADLQRRWGTVDPALRNQIRETLLITLQNEPQDVRHTAALAIAKVAAIDLPLGEWPTLVDSLLRNMSETPLKHGVRQATLETLGYICEEMAVHEKTVLTPQQINTILTAVVSGMTPEEPDPATRLAATTALSNAIEFAEHNFEIEQERNYIMQMVCQGTIAPEPRIRIASFNCLHEIAANYYAKLPAYITEIFNMTVKAINEDNEEVGLQAVEFWSTLCDYELELEEEENPEEGNHHFITAVVPHLTPVLLKQLTRQEETPEVDDTTWNMAMAAGTCLGLMARVAKDNLTPHVLPFVQENIAKATAPEDWRFREAATFAFGSILEGPDPTSLIEVVRQAMDFLLRALKDPHPYVRDTTAWTVGRVLEFLHDPDVTPAQQPLITKDSLPYLVPILLEGLKDEVHIAARICDAIGFLAAGYQILPDNVTSSPLSPFAKEIITALLHASQRPDVVASDTCRLQINAFEAINEMIRAASPDTMDTVAALIPVFLQELIKTFSMASSSAEARERQSELQGQLCGVLMVIMQKLSEKAEYKPAVLPYADGIMDTLLRVFAGQSSTVHEEAMLAVGACTYACGRQFTKYLPAFYPYLQRGLTNHQEWQVCLSTVGVLGDVARNVEDDLYPYCDGIMGLLITNLGSHEVHRSIKPQILSAFGDLALVLGDKYEKYLNNVKQLLQQAMQLSMQQATSRDEDFMDYNNELRIGILEAYSGIFQGLGPGKADQHMKSDLPLIVEFANSIGQDTDPDDQVVRNCVALLGDICAVVTNAGPVLQSASTRDWEKLLNYCHDNDRFGPDMEWAVNAVTSAVQQAAA